MINTPAILIGNTLSIVLVAILMYNLPYGFTRESAKARVFTWFSVPIVAGAVFGIGSAAFDNVPGTFAKLMVWICGTVGILAPIMVGFLFWLYVETSTTVTVRSLIRNIAIALIPVAIVVILVIANIFVPIVFRILPGNIYERGPLGLVAFLVSPLYLIIALFRITYLKAKRKAFLFVSIAGVIIPILIVAIIQARFYGIIQTWPGFSVGMISLYIGMEKDFLYKDSMTKVFNRMYLDYVIREAQLRNVCLGGIMVDIDHFKSINDTMGHHMGDEVIKKAAQILKASVGEAIVIRVGGDEFLVVLYTESMENLKQLMIRIRERAEIESNTKALPVSVEFSMGCDIYIPYEEEAQWLSRMDENMYKEKARHRRERRADRRSDRRGE